MSFFNAAFRQIPRSRNAARNGLVPVADANDATLLQLVDIDFLGPDAGLNFKTSNMRRWRRAKARVLSQTGRGRICCIGDSTTYGIGATDGVGRRVQAFPAMLARQLNASGVPCISQSLHNGRGTTFSTYDPTLTTGAGWSYSSIETLGGALWGNSTTTNALAWLPPVNVDTFEIYTPQNTGYGTTSWQINAGGATNIVQNGASAFIKTNATASLGSNTLNLARVSGQCYVAGVVAYDSATSAVDIVNMGRGALTSTILNDSVNPWSPVPAMETYAPDVILLTLGINDYSTSIYGISIDTYRTNLNAILTAWTAIADVVVVIPAPSDATRADLAQQEQYNNVTRDAVFQFDLPVIDMVSAWESYVVSNGLGYMTDNVHPSRLGYADQGFLIAQSLLRI